MNTDVIRKILDWFRMAVPDPTTKNKAVQVGCHLEEVAEMCFAIGVDIYAVGELVQDAGDYYKRGGELPDLTPDQRLELLDALCDQIVTAVGVAHMYGMDIETGLHRVNGSNWSKFVDGQPVFDENGKVKKGPGYFKPDLRDLIN